MRIPGERTFILDDAAIRPTASVITFCHGSMKGRPNTGMKPYLAAAALFLGTASAAQGVSPRLALKWLGASTAIHLDRWGGADSSGNGFSWKRKNRLYNPPQTLAVVNLGAGLAFSPSIGLSISVPFFRNAIDPYASAFGGDVPGQKASGIGDLELAFPLRFGAIGIQPAFHFPWAYQAGFLKPWSGLGVYRAGLGAFWNARSNLLWAAGDMVILKPEGERPGLVEPFDFALKGGYSRKHRFARRFQAKAGADLSFTSFSWSGDKPQHNYSLDPKAALSFLPAPGQEIALSSSATLYSYQGGSRTYHTYASRRVSLGLSYARSF